MWYAQAGRFLRRTATEGACSPIPDHRTLRPDGGVYGGAVTAGRWFVGVNGAGHSADSAA
jgi:hypothetical protein